MLSRDQGSGIRLSAYPDNPTPGVVATHASRLQRDYSDRHLRITHYASRFTPATAPARALQCAVHSDRSPRGDRSSRLPRVRPPGSTAAEPTRLRWRDTPAVGCRTAP